MVEIIEAEADDLAGPRDRKSEFQPGERPAGGGWRPFGEVGKRLQVAVAAAQDFAEVGGHGGIHRLQIDNGVAVDHAEPQAIIRFETDNFHEVRSRIAMTGARPWAGRCKA